MSIDDAIADVVTAEDPRLNYPSRHDWNWMDQLGESYAEWLDAAYPAINRLARERDEARAEVERLRLEPHWHTVAAERNKARADLDKLLVVHSKLMVSVERHLERGAQIFGAAKTPDPN